MRVTVLGAGGFIGRHLTAYLRGLGHEVVAVDRVGLAGFLAGEADAGHVIYCIGLTGDFRTRPLETAEAHAGLVARVLQRGGFASLLYLSSTRLYARAEGGREDTPLPVQPAASGDLYNATKLAGEALCLSDPRPSIRVARLSNVYGPGMGEASFLGQVLAEGAASGRVTLGQSMRSAKDYIAIEDAVRLLAAIALGGGARLYNVASGVNVTHDALARELYRAFGWQVSATEDAVAQRFPRIDINRVSMEFGAPVHSVLDDLPALGRSHRQEVAC